MICLKCRKSIQNDEDKVHGLHQDCFLQWFDLSKIEDFEEVTLQSVLESGRESIDEINSSFFQGKFKKYSARLNNDNFILKVSDQNYPELSITEFVCNQIAEKIGLEIPSYYLIRIYNQVDTFVTKNFISGKKPENLVHIYHFLSDSQAYTCETLVEIIKTKTNSLKSINNFIDICLFDALIGNHDRHGRNLALIKSKNKYVLAPCYDNPSYIAIEDEFMLAAQLEPRGKIATNLVNDPTMSDYANEFNRLGYQNNVKSFYKKIKISEIEKLIKESFLKDIRKKALINLITRRYKELENVSYS